MLIVFKKNRIYINKTQHLFKNGKNVFINTIRTGFEMVKVLETKCK